MPGVHVPQMKQGDSILDVIGKGLQIAQTIYGIKNTGADQKRKDEDLKREYAKDFDRVEAGTAGSTETDIGGEKVSWLPRKKEAGVRAPVKVTEHRDGKTYDTYMDPSEAVGKSFLQPPAAPKPDKSNENAMNLRKEYNSNKVTQDTMLRSSYYNQIADTVASGDDSGPADISLVFSFMKMNDPGSTVREGEYATAENSGGVSDKIRNIYNKLQDGQRLTPDQRQAFVKQAENMMSSQLKAQSQQDARYADLAKRWNIDPKDVIDPTFADISQKISQRSNFKKPGAGEAFAAPSDAVPGYDLKSIDEELRARGVKIGGGRANNAN